MSEDSRAFIGQDKTVGCALEERLAKRGLKRSETATHGGLRQPEAARRGTECSEACDCEEEFEIAPFQQPSLKQNCMIFIQYLSFSFIIQ
jgi:hypothetical protein